MPQPKLKIAASDELERVDRLPVGKKRGAGECLVLALSADDGREENQLPDLRAGDRLRALAEVEVTTDHHEAKISIGEPYAFDPEVRMRLLLADNVKGRDGQVLAEGTWRCSQTRHHHVLSLDQALAINAAQATGKHLVAVLDAWHRQAEDGQIVLVGQNEGVSKVINQDMARISAVRYRGAKDDDGQTSASDQARVSELPLSSDRRGVYALELRNLRQGEQFIVKARLLTSTTRLAHPARVSTRLILTEDRLGLDETALAGEIATFRGRVGKHNGSNSLQENTETKRTAVFRIRKDYKGPLFLKLVGTAGEAGYTHRPGDVVQVRPGGGLEVRRFGPELYG